MLPQPMIGTDRLYLFCAVNYFAQGMAGIVYEPLNYRLKDGLKLSAGQTAVFVAWMTAPFLIKPLFGLLADLLPRRRARLAAGAAVGAAGWLALAAAPVPGYGLLLALLILVNCSVAFCDVTCDGVMVEKGKLAGKTGTYQAVQIGTLYATLLLTGVGGGWLAARVDVRAVFALAAVFPLLVAGSAFLVKAAPAAPAPAAVPGALRGLVRSRRFWALCLMIFLWNFYPFLGTAQFYFQSETLHMGPLYIGLLSTLGGAAGVAGAAFFGSTVRRWGTERFLRAGVLVSAATGLLYLLYRGSVSAALLTVFFGALGVVFRLALMDLAARSCPKGAEATAFAVYMAVFNFAALASNAAGGRIYDLLREGFAPGPAGAYRAAAALILTGSLCTLSCWWLLPAALGSALPERRSLPSAAGLLAAKARCDELPSSAS
ncbi:MAG: MFS transporter [Elusimicrobia bacterium]|nr:MFS transporter [Elusimicrobiota bacterium]